VEVGVRDTILIVDDEPIIRELLVDFLKFHGFRTRDAENGIAALKVLNNDPNIAIVFSDVLMPGMNGFELCSKSKVAKPDVPFVIVSGNCSLYKSRTNETQADAYVEKPFDYEEILHLVRQVLH
jgi:DNA-binding NtrC family response regulator